MAEETKELLSPKLDNAQVVGPIHPGEIPREEFLKPMGISINRLAREIMVPPGRISEIVNGKRGITADTALRLARAFGTSPDVARASGRV